jgi:hypothetical protein
LNGQPINNLHACTNCGHQFEGKYCPECGQPVKTFLKPFPHYFAELLKSLFSADSRLWNSLIAQLIRPGRMVNDYLNGKSVRFMPPVRLYLFSSFIFFLVLNQFTSEIIELDKEPFIAVKTSNSPDENITESGNSDATILQESDAFSIDLQSNADSTLIRKKIHAINSNPRGFVQLFFRYLSWSMILLMPLMGFFLWLMFRKFQPFYAPHFMLALVNHSTAFLIFSAGVLLDVLWANRPVSFFILGMPLIAAHLFTGIRQLNISGIGATIIRVVPALLLYFISLILCMAVVLSLSWSQFT